jgi:alpha-tubulin suppressor-like RCC1 family protein
VRTPGAAYCWGDDGFGQLGNGAPKSDTNQPSAVIGGLTFALVAPSQVHACALTTTGAAYCWGSNLNGRLGQDTLTTTESLTPIAVTGGLTFNYLVSGESFSCGLTAGGALYCWGLNDSGQLGTGSPDNATTPTPVSGGLSFAAISAGRNHVCGVTTGGQAYCWGGNALGQLGDGTVFDRDTPTPVSQP